MNEIFASLGIHPVQILMNMVGFAVLFWLLRKFLFAPIGNMLEARNLQIQNDLEQAEQHRRQMAAAQGELEQRLANIETEVRNRIQAAEREAQRLREQLLAEAREERERIVEAGVAELRREREKALVEIRNLVADLSMLAAGKIVEAQLDVEAHRAMIDDIVEHGVR